MIIREDVEQNEQFISLQFWILCALNISWPETNVEMQVYVLHVKTIPLQKKTHTEFSSDVDSEEC